MIPSHACVDELACQFRAFTKRRADIDVKTHRFSRMSTEFQGGNAPSVAILIVLPSWACAWPEIKAAKRKDSGSLKPFIVDYPFELACGVNPRDMISELRIEADDIGPPGSGDFFMRDGLITLTAEQHDLIPIASFRNIG